MRCESKRACWACVESLSAAPGEVFLLLPSGASGRAAPKWRSWTWRQRQGNAACLQALMWRKENARSQTRRRRHTRKKSTLRALSCNGREVFISQPRTRHTRGTQTRRTQKPNRTLCRSQDASAHGDSYVQHVTCTCHNQRQQTVSLARPRAQTCVYNCTRNS